MCSAGASDRQYLSGHRYRQRDAGEVLRARRLHGRRGRGLEGPVRRQETVDARFRQVENVRHAHDRSGQPASAGVAGGHPVPAVRGARSSAGGHRHLPRRGVRGPGQPDVPAEGVAEQVGQDPRRSQFAVRQEPEVLFPNQTLQTVLTNAAMTTTGHRALVVRRATALACHLRFQNTPVANNFFLFLSTFNFGG